MQKLTTDSQPINDSRRANGNGTALAAENPKRSNAYGPWRDDGPKPDDRLLWPYGRGNHGDERGRG